MSRAAGAWYFTRVKTWLIPLCLTVVLALPTAASAVVVERLYEASVPVADQSEAERTRAMRDALGVVLVRISGQQAAAQLEVVSDLVRSAPRMVQQFRYETLEQGRGLRLVVRFDPRAVQRAAIDLGVPVWGDERPALLVWLAYDDGSRRGLLDEFAPEGIARMLTEVAELRGVPVIVPLMDLEDRTALAFTDVWGGFEDRILAASERYRPNAVLVGRLFRVDSDRWSARWSLYEDDTAGYAETAPGMLATVVGDGIHWVADGFGRRFAVMPDARRDGRTRLLVEGITDMGAYATLYRYLEGLSPVGSVAVEGAEGDRMTFALELRGTVQQLQQAIALGSRLRPGDPVESLDGSLHYRLGR
jgi:uncharacterized protein